MSIIKTEIKTGESRRVGNYELTPLSQVIKVQIPWFHAALTWNRPRAVILKTDDGSEQTLPVTDVTRVAIWAILAGGLIGAIILSLKSRHT